MIYIEEIKLISHSYPGSNVISETPIKCSEINLLVGDQGCGKSTMLQLLHQNHKDLEITLTDFTKEKGVETFIFDSEKDNPRVKSPELYTNADGTNKGIGYGGALISRLKSHGEILENFTIYPLYKAKNCVIFLDEPESGLSIKNQFKLINAINAAVENNCQLFIATHCYPLIESYNVINMVDNNRPMRGKDYIKLFL